MKKALVILQWIFAFTLVISSIANGFHFSSFLIAISAILFMPIPTIRNFLRNKLKIKSSLSVIIASILFIIGVCFSPITNSNNTEPTDTNIISDITTQIIDIQTTSSTTQSESTAPDIKAVGAGKAIKVTPSEIPSYSENPYVIINNNQPNFSVAELSVNGTEQYSDIDEFGRCGTAFIMCGKDTIPYKNVIQDNIDSIEPSGWIQAEYDEISGGYLWNRCRLIGEQLSAENANKNNINTGTRYMNIDGMLHFETMVADYIKDTGNHVAYRVTPIFEDSNLVCDGIQIEAYSVEDNGEGICFNVYCYNVQPDITIDYSTGYSYTQNNNTPTTIQDDEFIAETEVEESEIEDTEPEPINQPENAATVWVVAKGKKYHKRSGCSNMRNPYQISLSDAINRGYEPCKKCY